MYTFCFTLPCTTRSVDGTLAALTRTPEAAPPCYPFSPPSFPLPILPSLQKPRPPPFPAASRSPPPLCLKRRWPFRRLSASPPPPPTAPPLPPPPLPPPASPASCAPAPTTSPPLPPPPPSPATTARESGAPVPVSMCASSRRTRRSLNWSASPDTAPSSSSRHRYVKTPFLGRWIEAREVFQERWKE